MDIDDMPMYMTTAEVAIVARTVPDTVRFWRHVGKGPRSAKVGRRVIYRREDVREWLEGRFEDGRNGGGDAA